MKTLSTLILIGACQLAYAGLGDNVNNVTGHQSSLMAQRRFQSVSSYTTNVTTLPTGTVVQEYVSQSGKVFAVTWDGPVAPDLSQLLGSYQGIAHREVKRYRERHPGVNAPVSLSSDDFVLQSGGRMRAYFGKAY